jgi:hypothetical protein
MAVTFSTDIVADPSAYLARNVAAMAGKVSLQPGQSGKFIAAPYPTFKVRYRTGSQFLGMGNAKADGEAFDLRWMGSGAVAPGGEYELFDAIWSGYEGGKPTHCDLPGGGPVALMLTPRLDGCTITCAARAGGGARFGHYNLKEGADTLSGEEMAKAARANHPGENPGILTKEFYYSKAKREVSLELGKRTMAYAFGVRLGGTWRFFVQYLESKGDGYQIRGVDELVSGSQRIAPAQ